MSRLLLAAMIVVAACADRGGGTSKPIDHGTPTKDATEQGTEGTAMASVTITSAGERPGRPPLIRLLVNRPAANPAADERWVLISSKLPGGSGGVDKLEQLTAPGGVAI